mmetsp:Transcript_18373/g.40605  ORF Transcript_18373/g.40605 Transcript_18373/m.40605 type:complete len:250 (+) Transcript_18373:642-1391(+)
MIVLLIANLKQVLQKQGDSAEADLQSLDVFAAALPTASATSEASSFVGSLALLDRLLLDPVSDKRYPDMTQLAAAGVLRHALLIPQISNLYCTDKLSVLSRWLDQVVTPRLNVPEQKSVVMMQLAAVVNLGSADVDFPVLCVEVACKGLQHDVAGVRKLAAQALLNCTIRCCELQDIIADCTVTTLTLCFEQISHESDAKTVHLLVHALLEMMSQPATLQLARDLGMEANPIAVPADQTDLCRLQSMLQ